MGRSARIRQAPTEALCEAGHVPRWIAGTSIGAINAAIIAGNPAQRRVPRLRQFWEKVSSRLLGSPLADDGNSREIFNETSSVLSAATGVPGFFALRIPPSVIMPRGTPEAISVYDTEPLKVTLNELVDFDLLNSGAVRLSIGAAQVLTGNMQYFDTDLQTIGPEHVMASGGLPPGFPPIEIEGEPFWDGRAGFQHAPRSTSSSEVVHARTCASIRLTSSVPKALCLKRFSKLRNEKKRYAIRAAPGSIPTSFANYKPSAELFGACGPRCRKS